MSEHVKTRLKKSIRGDKANDSEDEDRVDELAKLPRRAAPCRVRRQTMTANDRTSNVLSPFAQPLSNNLQKLSNSIVD